VADRLRIAARWKLQGERETTLRGDRDGEWKPGSVAFGIWHLAAARQATDARQRRQAPDCRGARPHSVRLIQLNAVVERLQLHAGAGSPL
jgi:hypothetical protein